jgi:hypothetical protein
MGDINDDLVRRIADCLEQHLPDYGFDPARYPSGENKSIDLRRDQTITISDATGHTWRLDITPAIG